MRESLNQENIDFTYKAELNSNSEESQGNEVNAETEAKAEQYQNIDFQPGVHPRTFGHVLEAFRSNWYKTEIWDHRVAERLATEPQSHLCIDGLTPDVEPTSIESNQQKNVVWITLPGVPKVLNPEGVVTVIAGDITIGNTETGFNEYPEIAQYLLDLDARRHSKDTAIRSLQVLGGIAGVSAGIKAGKEAVESPNEKMESKRFSRRAFFKGLAATGAIAVISGVTPVVLNQARNRAANTTSQAEMEERVQNLQKYGFLEKVEDIWDGRTALLIQKTKETLAYENQPTDTKAGVVLGSGHIANSQEYLKQKTDREKAIAKMFDSLKEIIEKFGRENNVSSDEIFEHYLLTAATIQTYEVKQPDTDPENPNPKALYESINITGQYRSPMVERIIREKYPEYAHVLDK